MSILINNPGALTTLQDLGRFGGMSSGFSQGGAMDALSLLECNRLLMNNDSDGCLEMTLTGVSCTFTEPCVIAVTGADMGFKLNKKELKRGVCVEVREGDELVSGFASNGMRAYLGVAGGFDVKPFMGSYSTNLKIKQGGFEGRKLNAGDELKTRYRRDELLYIYNRRCEPRTYSSEITLRVVMGPQDDYFTDEGIKTFLTEKYVLTKDSDRMGARLDGAKIESKSGVDVISDGIALGAVQIPASGTPIIMCADRQTVGGYAKIATVISADMPLLAQSKPGASIRFERISVDGARNELKKMYRELDALEYGFLR